MTFNTLAMLALLIANLVGYFTVRYEFRRRKRKVFVPGSRLHVPGAFRLPPSMQDMK